MTTKLVNGADRIVLFTHLLLLSRRRGMCSFYLATPTVGCHLDSQHFAAIASATMSTIPSKV